MKRCYYEILDVEKKAATSAIKAVNLYLFRHIEKWHSNITPIKMHQRKVKRYSWRFKKRMMYFLMPTKEPFMITIVRGFCLIRIKCQRKTSNNTVLVLIFGNVSQWDALKDIMMIRVDSIMFIEMFLKKSRHKKEKLSNREMICKNKWENTKALEQWSQISRKYYLFTTIGKTLQLTRLSHGQNNMTPELQRIAGLNVVCKKKTKKSD